MSEYIKILIFKIGQEYYAADIMEVERILAYEEPTQLPDAPLFVKGVINYEKTILPLVSLSDRFNLNTNGEEKESKIIVAKDPNNRMGVIVDFVNEVKDIEKDDIEAPPMLVSGISQKYLKGLIKVDGQIIIFLNLSKILTDDEKEALIG